MCYGKESSYCDCGLDVLDRLRSKNCSHIPDMTRCGKNNMEKRLLKTRKKKGVRMLVRCSPEVVGEMVIPEDISVITNTAFESCEGITSIVIHDELMYVLNGAFYDCSNLTSIKVSYANICIDSRENCNAVILTDENKLIAACKNTFIPDSVQRIGDFAFVFIPITTIKIPKSVKSIGDYAFCGCWELTSLKICNGLRSICKGVFQECIRLQSVKIPCSVRVIGEEAFAECSSLTSIEIGRCVEEIGRYAFFNCSRLTSIKVARTNRYFDSRDDCNALIDTKYDVLLRGCVNTVIPESIKKIWEGAFSMCSGLREIHIPDSVTYIASEAFYGCTNLASVNIPSGVTYICAGTFDRCRRLTSVTIPENVTGISFEAFRKCGRLTEVRCLARTVPQLKERVFDGVPLERATLYVPKSAIKEYSSTETWKDFGRIIPLEES